MPARPSAPLTRGLDVCRYEAEDTEAPPIVPDRRPQASWPSAGVIEAQGLYVRYREELPPVLKGISFCTKPGEKAGAPMPCP